VKNVDEVFELVLEGGANYDEYKTEPKKQPKKRLAKPKTLPVPNTENREGVRC
jgi:hypothetical protein